MWLRLMFGLMLAACGRLHFDALGELDGDGGIGDGGDPDGMASFVAAPPCGCTHVATGITHSCTRLATGTVLCWGYNLDGQLGDTSGVSRGTPAPVSGITDALAVFAGDQHTCVRRPTTMSCWGLDTSGQCGDGTAVNNGTPTTVTGLGSSPLGDGGGAHTCFVDGTGQASCAGDNFYGQLADGTAAGQRVSPVGIGGPADVQDVATGESFSCFVRAAGAVECAGRNIYGQLGDGTTTNRSSPAPVTGIVGASQVVAGEFFACARIGGSVVCWGHNNAGQLGDGTMMDSLQPVAVVGLNDAIDLAAGQTHACAIRGDKTLVCWGGNTFGALGNGTYANSSSTPTAVLYLTNVAAVDAAASHTCAIADGGLYCWGFNNRGQLGNGLMMGYRVIATPVVGF